MKRFLCFLSALLLNVSSEQSRYYVCVIYQNGSAYKEFMTETSFKVVVSDFYLDSSIESLFITRDINYVP